MIKISKISLLFNSFQPTLNLKRNRQSHWAINELITADGRLGDTCCRIETITGHQFKGYTVLFGWVGNLYLTHVILPRLSREVCTLVACVKLVQPCIVAFQCSQEYLVVYFTIKMQN